MGVVIDLPSGKNIRKNWELLTESLEFLVLRADEQIHTWRSSFLFLGFLLISSDRPCNFGPLKGKCSRNLTFTDPFRKMEKYGKSPPSILSSISFLLKFFMIPSMLIMKQLWNLPSSGAGELSQCFWEGKKPQCFPEKKTVKHNLHNWNCHHY